MTPDDFIDNVRRLNAAIREYALLHRNQPYMRNAHLLPPSEEFSSVDSYVKVLKLFERAPVTEVYFYRFLPTLAQRRANAEVSANGKRPNAVAGAHPMTPTNANARWACCTGAALSAVHAPRP